MLLKKNLGSDRLYGKNGGTEITCSFCKEKGHGASRCPGSPDQYTVCRRGMERIVTMKVNVGRVH